MLVTKWRQFHTFMEINWTWKAIFDGVRRGRMAAVGEYMEGCGRNMGGGGGGGQPDGQLHSSTS